jgi:hypothetical protein
MTGIIIRNMLTSKLTKKDDFIDYLYLKPIDHQHALQ